MYHEQILQSPESNECCSLEVRRVALSGRALVGTKTGRTWQNVTFLTKAEDLRILKDHISRPRGPIFLGISPGRSLAAPV